MREQPLYGTQGGGIAGNDEAGNFVLLKAPSAFPHLQGQPVPDDWGLIPLLDMIDVMYHDMTSDDPPEEPLDG